jgi:hypothetical protein
MKVIAWAGGLFVFLLGSAGFASPLENQGARTDSEWGAIVWQSAQSESPMSDIWVDGEALRSSFESLRETFGDGVDVILNQLLGMRLKKNEKALSVAIYFSHPIEFDFNHAVRVANWKPYGVMIPKTIRFRVRLENGSMSLDGMNQDRNALILKVSMPWLSDRVWLRRIDADLLTGQTRVEAGVLADGVAVVADGNATEKTFSGFQLKESLHRSFAGWAGLFRFSDLLFRRK